MAIYDAGYTPLADLQREIEARAASEGRGQPWIDQQSLTARNNFMDSPAGTQHMADKAAYLGATPANGGFDYDQFAQALSGFGNLFTQNTQEPAQSGFNTQYNQSATLPLQYQPNQGQAQNGYAPTWNQHNPFKLGGF